MGIKHKQAGTALAALSAIAIGSVGFADAASTTTNAGPGNPNETTLTGATLSSATAAAIAAVPGGTVDGATTEDPKDPSAAAYEVHVTKTDGAHVQVLEDSAFKVLSTKAGGPGHGGPGHGHGPGNEKLLTGATLTSASDAALAQVPGGKVERASTEDPTEASGAAYEVHVTKADGTHVKVLEDSAFKGLSVKTAPAGGHGDPGGPRH